MADDRITIGDAANAGFCVKGVRAWCASNNRDFRDFVKRGIPLDEARKMNDAYIGRILRMKRGG